MNPNLPVGRETNAMMQPGSWSVSLSTTTTYLRTGHLQECPDIGPACEAGPQTPYRHDQTLLLSSADLSGEIGVNEWLAVGVVAPLRYVRTTIENTTIDGAPYDPPDAGIHHRNETLAGIGDPELTARMGRRIDDAFFASVRVGSTVPLGRTESNPFTAGHEGERHQHIQFGAGIFQPVLGVDLIGNTGPVQMVFATSTTLAMYENRHGLRPSSRVAASLTGTHDLGRDDLRVGGGVVMAREFSEKWSKDHPETEGNLGRTDVLATVRAVWIPTASLAAHAAFSTPLYSSAVGADLDYPGSVTVGVTFSR